MSKARDLANLISGGFTEADIPALSASKITSGTFADARLSSSSVTQHVDLTSLSADNLTSGTVPSARLSLSASDVPDLATSKITSGTFADARLSASSITQHVDLSNLNASNLTSGTVPNARYGTPTFNGSNITNLSTSMTTGTWTPGVSSGSLSNTSGQYQKIGQFVFCQFECQLSGSPAMGSQEDTNWYMTGLPFTAKSYSTGYNGTWFPSMGNLSQSGDIGIGAGYQIGVKDNTTNFYIHGNQGWRNTQYYTTHGYGGVRNRTVKLGIYDRHPNESWIYGRIFYVSAS